MSLLDIWSWQSQRKWKYWSPRRISSSSCFQSSTRCGRTSWPLSRSTRKCTCGIGGSLWEMDNMYI
ncbi:unnamed protein product [Gulo gulo]|uniref:Uncharacterized protein n=1 Tax=Gulo gulo TaxID=48420 RepID=A0A9X9LGF7_GULGU|nr:unnamed protein product [Gulo gulo]